MEYTKFKVYYNSDGTFKKAEMSTSIGNFSISDEDKFKLALADFARQKGMTETELMNDSLLVEKVESKKKKSTKLKKPKVSEMSDEEYKYYSAAGGNKKKNLLKTGLAITTAGLVIAAGSWAISKLGAKKVNSNNTKAPTAYEDIVVNPTAVPYYPEVTEEPYYDDSYDYGNTGYDGMVDRNDENSQVIYQLANNGTVDNYSETEILDAINVYAGKMTDFTFEISQYINDRGSLGPAYYYDYETLFNGNSTDYLAVKMFSKMTNDIIIEAYQNNNKENTISLINSFCDVYTDFVFCGGEYTFELNGQYYSISFNDLSDMAKFTILDLGREMFNIDLDYSYDNGNYQFTKEDIIVNTGAMLEDELVPRLVDRGHRR